MVTIGYHASHEQFPPDLLLDLVKRAEGAGFASAMCSDHLTPWSERHGHSGFAWSWLGAGMEGTTLPFGIVTSPIGLRYHPLHIAQAGATLSKMYTERLWIALGSGEAMNERAFARGWPHKEERDRRLEEAAGIIRALWRGETVTREGAIPVLDGRVHSLPLVPPRLVAAVLSPESARRHARWADGMITVNQPPEKLWRVVEAFREGGGGGKPMYLQVHLSYAGTLAEVEANALDQWRTNALPGSVAPELWLPEQFDAATSFVRVEDLQGSVRMSADPAEHASWLRGDVELGFEQLLLHNVGRNQEEFIDVFGEKVLPAIESQSSAAGAP